MKITRRNFILTSAAAVSALVVDNKSVFASGKNPVAGTGNPLRLPVQIPGGNLSIGTTSAQLLSGNPTDVLSINAAYPAPTIRIKKGDTFSAVLMNNLGEDVVIHWHGLHVPSPMDGHPMNAIKPGATAEITYPIINRAGTYFYHSHTDMKTAEQVYRGLAGMYIIDDDEDGALPLPRGEFEVPLMITDKRFDANNQLIYQLTDADMQRGWLGEKILVNGTPDPFLEVAPTLYRLRIVNASNARIYKIALSDNSEFTVIGGDGGLLETPVKTKSCFLATAERLDILVDFSKYSQGASVTLKSLAFSTSDAPPPDPIPAQGEAVDIIRFDVTKSGDSKASIPAVLSVIEKYKESDAVRIRDTFTFTSNSVGHFINGKEFEMERIDTTIPFGDLEIWTFLNGSERLHPIHVHGTQFQILERDNNPISAPNDMGWKDTVLLNGTFSQVKVLIRFNEYDGRYLLHCHNLEHEDHGMMSNFVVENNGAVAQDSGTVSELILYPNPANTKTTVRVSEQDWKKELVVYDLNGKQLIREVIPEGLQAFQVDVKLLAEGSYWVELNGQRAMLKIVR